MDADKEKEKKRSFLPQRSQSSQRFGGNKRILNHGDKEEKISVVLRALRGSILFCFCFPRAPRVPRGEFSVSLKKNGFPPARE